MKIVFFILTSKCNKSCPFCFYNQDDFRRKDDVLNSEICFQVLKNLKKYDYGEVTFTGGEPLLRQEMLLKLIKKAKKLKYITNLNTNGTLINESCLKKLSSAGLDHLYLSAEYFKDIDDKILELISKLFKNIKIIKVISAQNLNSYKTLLTRTRKYNLDIILQPAYINLPELTQLDLKRSSVITKNFLKIIKNWSSDNDKNDYYNLIKNYYLDAKKIPKKCWLGEKGLIIDSDGSSYPCFHRQDLVCGNVLKDKISDILTNRKKYLRFTKPENCFGEHCISLFY